MRYRFKGASPSSSSVYLGASHNPQKIEEWYQQGLIAIQKGESEQAQRLLTRVLTLDPTYKQATRYLHLAVTGIDPAYAPAKKVPVPKKSGPPLMTPLNSPPLSAWNPFDGILLIWWLLVMPSNFRAYRAQVGASTLATTGKWLVSSLIWLPLFIPTLAFTFGTLPHLETNPERYWALSFGLLGAWLLTGWFGDRDDTSAVITAMVSSILVASSTMYGMTGHSMSAIAGSVALGIVLGMTLRLVLGIALTIVGGVAGGVALGMVGGVILGALGNIWHGASIRLTGGVTVGIASVVVLLWIGSFMIEAEEENTKLQLSWIGGLTFVLLIFTYAFLSWYSFLDGWMLFR